jgi:hypothetical protein
MKVEPPCPPVPASGDGLVVVPPFPVDGLPPVEEIAPPVPRGDDEPPFEDGEPPLEGERLL